MDEFDAEFIHSVLPDLELKDPALKRRYEASRKSVADILGIDLADLETRNLPQAATTGRISLLDAVLNMVWVKKRQMSYVFQYANRRAHVKLDTALEKAEADLRAKEVIHQMKMLAELHK